MLFIIQHWYCGDVKKVIPDVKPWAVEFKHDTGTKKNPEWITESSDCLVVEADSVDEVINKYNLKAALVWTPIDRVDYKFPHWTIWVTDGELKFGQR